MSCLKFLVLLTFVALACKPSVAPPPVPPPPPPNSPPVAAVGGPYASSDGTVSFDGSASSDPDGDALTYRWDFGDGASSDIVKPSHTYQQDGNYAVSLVVTDSKGAASVPAGTTAAIARAAVLVGAGNIASGGGGDEATARLLDAIPGTVFTAGDNAFPDGSDSIYAKYYAPTWGRHIARTRPALGNHDYHTDGANGAFNYFGDRLGQRGLGYYSYELGAWHVVVLNDKGESGMDQAQLQWLAGDLNTNTKRCTVAIWHVPLFTSSNTAGYTVNPNHRPLWDVLYSKGVDVVINGHPHHYERFTPMTPTGAVDQTSGIRQFSAGTGGGDGVSMPTVFHPNSEVQTATFGVLKLTLKADSYDWQFVPVAGASFSDSGSGTCH